jgi:hypothetical protein
MLPTRGVGIVEAGATASSPLAPNSTLRRLETEMEKERNMILGEPLSVASASARSGKLEHTILQAMSAKQLRWRRFGGERVTTERWLKSWLHGEV